MENQVQNMDDKVYRKVDNLHVDPAKKVAILQRLARLDVSHLSHSDSNRGGLLPLAGQHISFPFTLSQWHGTIPAISSCASSTICMAFPSSTTRVA